MSDINITPLVDVVLVLLLIFMITAPVLQSGIQVAVPHTRQVNQLSEVHLVVTIDKDQNVFLQDKPVNIHDLSSLLAQNPKRKESHLRPRRRISPLRRLRLRNGRRQTSRHQQHQHRHPTASEITVPGSAFAFLAVIPQGICFFCCLFLELTTMSTQAISRPTPDDQFRRGVIGAIALHLLIAAAFIGIGIYLNHNSSKFGESSSSVGSIQASMVSAIPLPQKAKPVDKSVSPPTTSAPHRSLHPKEAAAPPPRPTDIEVKAKTPPKKVAPITTTEPAQASAATPPTAKAQTGESATQLPQSTIKTVNGTATVTVQSRTFGERYAWYIRLISDKVQQSYSQQYPDPRSSMGRSVTITFYVDPSGSPTNVEIQTRSGSSNARSSR
jgi:protein TonB